MLSHIKVPFTAADRKADNRKAADRKAVNQLSRFRFETIFTPFAVHLEKIRNHLH